jgi:hypothetical protein
LPDYGFSEKPKRVAGNKSDVNSVLTDMGSASFMLFMYHNGTTLIKVQAL